MPAASRGAHGDRAAKPKRRSSRRRATCAGRLTGPAVRAATSSAAPARCGSSTTTAAMPAGSACRADFARWTRSSHAERRHAVRRCDLSRGPRYYARWDARTGASSETKLEGDLADILRRRRGRQRDFADLQGRHASAGQHHLQARAPSSTARIPTLLYGYGGYGISHDAGFLGPARGSGSTPAASMPWPTSAAAANSARTGTRRAS